MNQTEAIERAKEHFARLLVAQLKRVDQIKSGEDWADYSKLQPIIIKRCFIRISIVLS